MVHHRQRSANSRRVAGASAVVAAIAALLVVPATPAAAQEPVSFTGTTNYTAGHPYSVAAGDFNGDGHPDLAVANTSSDNVSIFLGTAGGTFTGPTNFPVGNGPV